MSCFDNWDDSLDFEPDQIKRRLNGEKIKADKITVDEENQSAEVIGSSGEVYHVSLAECSCMDYSIKRKPCKHMYRLADELGLSEPFPSLDKNAETAFIEVEVARCREEFFAGHISPAKYAKVIDALYSK